MKAGCAAQKLQFEAHGKRDVVADFDGGRMTSDGGGLLLLGRPDGAAGPVCLRLPPAGVGGAHGDGSDRPARVSARARVRGSQRSRHAAARPTTRIRIRADAGFCRDGILSWCEANAVGYVLGLARNPVLTRRLRHAMRRARRCCWQTGEAVAVEWR